MPALHRTVSRYPARQPSGRSWAGLPRWDPSKRDVLSHLTRHELLAVVDQFELEVPDRRVREGLLDAVGASKKATLATILPDLPRERLKAILRGPRAG
jgi:hypothetical protein